MKNLFLSFITSFILLIAVTSIASENEQFIPVYTVGNAIWSETLKSVYDNECVTEKQGTLIPCDHRYSARWGSTTAAESACRKIGAVLPYRSDVHNLFLQFDHYDDIIPYFNDGWLGQSGKSVALTDKGQAQLDAAFGGKFIKSSYPYNRGLSSIWTNQPIVSENRPYDNYNWGLYADAIHMRVISRSTDMQVRCIRRLK